MRVAAFRAVFILTGLVFTLPANAETCKGRWGGEVPTSVTFKSGNNARYCYQSQCWNVEWSGDKAKKLMLRFGDGGPTVEMKTKAGGYNATWRLGARSSRASLICN